MVSPAAAGWLALSLLAAAPDAGGPDAGDAEVRRAMDAAGFPWYDPRADTARPVWPPSPEVPARRGGGVAVGQSLVFALMTLGVAAVVAALALAFRLYTPAPPEASRPKPPPGRASRVEGLPLPEGLEIDLSDPWAQAQRLRRAGDRAGAAVALFVHLMLTLDRRGLSRLAPGRTARQVVRGVEEAATRRRVEPTLRLFEAAFYGRRVPSPEAFEAAWASAMGLRHLWEEEVAA